MYYLIRLMYQYFMLRYSIITPIDECLWRSEDISLFHKYLRDASPVGSDC